MGEALRPRRSLGVRWSGRHSDERDDRRSVESTDPTPALGEQPVRSGLNSPIGSASESLSAATPGSSLCTTERNTIAVSTAGWALLAVLFACIWVALAFWPARVAGRKGHSFLGYFILSLFCFPLALVMAYLVHDRTGGLAMG